MSVVVTGSTGHIGANLVRALLDKGMSTRTLIHEDRRAIEGLDVDVVAGDVRNRDSLLDAFAGAEVVYHLAVDISLLQSEWPQLEAVNITGVRNVVEACLHCGVRRLRGAGEPDYRIPYDGLYRWISCPNYFGEVIIWTGWAVATWSLPGLAFATWTAANLVPRARSHHKWYREHFPDYPPGRKALLPGLW